MNARKKAIAAITATAIALLIQAARMAYVEHKTPWESEAIK